MKTKALAKTSWKALGDRVVVQSGSGNPGIQECVVLSVGDSDSDSTADFKMAFIKVGDKVLIDTTCYRPFAIQDKECFILKQSEVLAVSRLLNVASFNGNS